MFPRVFSRLRTTHAFSSISYRQFSTPTPATTASTPNAADAAAAAAAAAADLNSVKLFMNSINQKSYSDKFSSWSQLINTKGRDLKKLEIPIKARKLILKGVEQYKQRARLAKVRALIASEGGKLSPAALQEKIFAVVYANVYDIAAFRQERIDLEFEWRLKGEQKRQLQRDRGNEFLSLWEEPKRPIEDSATEEELAVWDNSSRYIWKELNDPHHLLDEELINRAEAKENMDEETADLDEAESQKDIEQEFTDDLPFKDQRFIEEDKQALRDERDRIPDKVRADLKQLESSIGASEFARLSALADQKLAIAEVLADEEIEGGEKFTRTPEHWALSELAFEGTAPASKEDVIEARNAMLQSTLEAEREEIEHQAMDKLLQSGVDYDAENPEHDKMLAKIVDPQIEELELVYEITNMKVILDNIEEEQQSEVKEKEKVEAMAEMRSKLARAKEAGNDDVDAEEIAEAETAEKPSALVKEFSEEKEKKVRADEEDEEEEEEEDEEDTEKDADEVDSKSPGGSKSS